MAVWSRLPLSGSTNGRPIHIVSTANPGTTLHTVSTATAIKDHVYAWFWNQATTARQLTVLFGGTATGDELTVTLPAQDGTYNVLDGMTLVGATGIIVAAFGTATAGLFCGGHVDRAT